MSVLLRSERFRWVWQASNAVLLLCGVGAFALLLAEVGFQIRGAWVERLTAAVLGAFVVQEGARILVVAHPWRYVRSHWVELGVAVVAVALLAFRRVVQQGVHVLLPGVDWERVVLVYLVLTQALVVSSLAVRAVRNHARIGLWEIHPGALLLLSFVLLSLAGTGFLLLPAATVRGISLVDALFMATSAVCVTGLTVVDTATTFTGVGKVVLLVLIQLGGLGLMTFMSFFGLLFTAGLGVRERVLLGEIFAVESLAEMRQLVFQIVGLSLAVEFVGAALLYWYDGGGLPLEAERAFRALFHAVSAFCNAGFALYSDNLIAQQQNVPYLAVVAALVVLGGLGFPVLSALLALRPWKGKVWRLQHRLPVSARLVLLTTAALIVGGTVVLWLFERDGVFRSFSPEEQWFQALFLAVVPRTAGFNSVPMSELSVPASLVVVFLMWVGASPASTGGGVKTLTLAVALIGAVQLLRQGRVQLFHREIPVESVVKALSAVVASAAVLLMSAFVLQLLEPRHSWIDVLFEAASALGTVGLSRGITPELGTAAKLLLCVMMLVGRVGVLTVLSLLLPARPAERYRYPSEPVVIT